MKRKGLMTVVLFVIVYYVATAPAQAAGVVGDVRNVCGQIATAFVSFGAALS